MITVGAIFGGGELAGGRARRSIQMIGDLLKAEGTAGIGSINVVFHIPGSIVKPDYTGVRTGMFSRAEGMLMIQVAVPEEMSNSEELNKFLFESLRNAIELGKLVFRKAKIKYPTESYLALINRAENQIRS